MDKDELKDIVENVDRGDMGPDMKKLSSSLVALLAEICWKIGGKYLIAVSIPLKRALKLPWNVNFMFSNKL